MAKKLSQLEKGLKGIQNEINVWKKRENPQKN